MQHIKTRLGWILRISLLTIVVFLAIQIGKEYSTTAKTAAFVTRDPNELLTKLKTKFNSVRDYTADVVIKVKVEFLKIPITKAKIYYKAPDKIKVDAKGFAMLPRSGLDFANTSMLKNKYDAIYVKDELVNGINCAVVKVIPSDPGEVIISTMWIDPIKCELRKFVTTTKSNGTFDVVLTYDKAQPNLVMPASLNISFDVNKIQLPKSMSGDLTGETAHVEKSETKKTTRGQIFINYSNFKINQGLKDELFKEVKKK